MYMVEGKAMNWENIKSSPTNLTPAIDTYAVYITPYERRFLYAARVIVWANTEQCMVGYENDNESNTLMPCGETQAFLGYYHFPGEEGTDICISYWRLPRDLQAYATDYWETFDKGETHEHTG
jgi:hypothetical protein